MQQMDLLETEAARPCWISFSRIHGCIEQAKTTVRYSIL
jgi:hypothetical protein